MTTNAPKCPVCEQGKLVPHTYSEHIHYNGKSLVVSGLEGYQCPKCGADPVLTEQIRRNQCRFADAKRTADGLLTGKQIRELREALGLSQPDAALLFGGGANGFSKYERGQVMQSVAMDRLLKIVGAYPMLLDFLRVEAGQVSAAINTGQYAGEKRVSMNDDSYRSRILQTGTKVVSIQDWKSAA